MAVNWLQAVGSAVGGSGTGSSGGGGNSSPAYSGVQNYIGGIGTSPFPGSQQNVLLYVAIGIVAAVVLIKMVK